MKLNDGQKAKLKEIAKDKSTEIKKEIEKFQEAIKKMKEEAHSELLKVLTPEQHKIYEDLVGDPYVPKRK